MKKIIIGLFMLAVATVNAQLPQGKSPEERAEKRYARLTKELSLTAEQQTKVKQIILKNEQQRETKKQNEATKEENKKLRQSFDEELKAVLTPEQFTKLQETRKEMRAKHAKRGTPVAPATPEKK